MTATAKPAAGSRNLVLAAMIFAVAMTFIDQTIVSIAVPDIQRELDLSNTGVQWAVNAYLLTLAALFAYGGRLADTVGHRKVVVLGVVVFAASSLLCGLTPKGGVAQAWIVVFRAVQGAGGAIMFPAALGIVVQTFALRERGKALALFFGIAGGLTAVGPILGGYLTEWTWRAIFWVNIPVAAVALVLIAVSKPVTDHRPAPMDYRGLVLIAAGVTLSVFGFQQAEIWGWGNPGIGLAIGAGALLLVAFVLVELRTADPLMQVRIFRDRAFRFENIVLGITMLTFIPVFFFVSEYAQIALGKSASQAGLYLLYFFLGFIIASQLGGRMLDRGGAKRPVVLGCALSAVGFWLWAGKVTDLDFSDQTWSVILAGAGMGMMLTPASTDAVNRASRVSYGEATGITQTVRNYAASLGLAVLGTVSVTEFRDHLRQSLIARGVPAPQAADQAASMAQAHSGAQGGGGSIPGFVRMDFAESTRTVLSCMAGIMAVAAVVAFLGLQAGLQAEHPEGEGAAAQGQQEPPRT
ncbi:MFS transporter [Actinacidiphila bryophytorum]|uniref:Drug resistance transporter, EmrB/QacA subfamily n=1 Tax=Actinacidiphila bryophytorum TaxID=1436133 RepID=A0A9W4H2K6_9ACTN|nr:MFS transporter [Actinacidiphila bryophytorum]MBM9436916.1 MFS transporter [Actinacidiphila bryophytorum]MBN6545008.1 MFS transporter [Actinacidiphila bryophytorum]CAG7645797.1 Drug resistance transporter, EmrB/QacA subfamily [Actinacidiphila bryophytorum]